MARRKVRYKQTAIGVAWVVLQPLLTMGVFTLFFGRLAKLPSQGLPYPIFYFAALVPWTYFATALQNATNIVVENQRCHHQSLFPSLDPPPLGGPFRPGGLRHWLHGPAGMTLGTAFVPGVAALWLPVLLLLALLTALGVGLWLSALNALYRDVRYVIPFLMQFWMFASPVAYPSSLVPERCRWLYGLNPMAGVIDGFRWALTGHGQPPGPHLAACAAAVLLILFGGLLFFQRMEGAIADRV